jgi:hypothetical protein
MVGLQLTGELAWMQHPKVVKAMSQEAQEIGISYRLLLELMIEVRHCRHLHLCGCCIAVVVVVVVVVVVSCMP